MQKANKIKMQNEQNQRKYECQLLQHHVCVNVTKKKYKTMTKKNIKKNKKTKKNNQTTQPLPANSMSLNVIR